MGDVNRERKIKASERQRQALELRKAGITYADIAKRLGYRGASSAHSAVTRALERNLSEPAEELRKLEVERLDAMLLAIWPQATKGAYGAVDRALRIMERRARLLGLDKPSKIAPTDPTGEHEWLEGIHEQLQRKLAAFVDEE